MGIMLEKHIKKALLGVSGRVTWYNVIKFGGFREFP
jgi:hypothetical protein